MVHFVSVPGLEDPALEVYTKLSEVQLKRFYEPDGGLFIAESPKVVQRALDAGCLPVSLLVEDRHVKGEAAGVIAECGRMSGEIPVYTGRYEDLTRLTGYALTRGVLCAMKRPMLPTVEQVLQTAEAAAEKGAARIAVLENVMNPANVGSIFRNAAALGIDAVMLTDGCSDPLYRRTLRVSMGTTLQIPWTWIGRSIDEWKKSGLQMLKDRGYQTIAMALREDAVQIRNLNLGMDGKAAVILGAEGDGLLPETIEGADRVTVIPMTRGVDSLNVAAASAIAFFEIGRRTQY
ncbi:MAG: RNA methyltransferase [Eubacteriales bacterium]|nr:RNA methyltransferase [Eubacteriales bacterium]